MRKFVIFENNLYEKINCPDGNHLIAPFKFSSITPKYGATSPKDIDIVIITSYLHLILWFITKYLPLISVIFSLIGIIITLYKLFIPIMVIRK